MPRVPARIVMLFYLLSVIWNRVQSSIITKEPAVKPISREMVWKAAQSKTRIRFIIVITIINIKDRHRQRLVDTIWMGVRMNR